ncbi:tetratricopeptide repeat protein [Actinokineospora soli]|uniref:Tetratricopeptide repeat protein n=1 Tax=Actinokineospora soli TaxID=1048753 RepID=A0ABW2THD7_9PSEU
MPRLARRAGQWLVAGVLALAGVGVAVLKPLGVDHWNWLAVVVLAVAAVAAVVGKLTLARMEREDKHRDETRQVVSSGALREGRVRVGELSDPTVLGVHRAVTPHGTSLEGAAGDEAELLEGVPVYVPRDRHEEVVAALKPGAFVLLVGDSAAGKSRLAFEATREVLGKHRLFVPEPQALAAVINEAATERRALLWLDDLERFLTGDNSLNVTMLDRLLNHPDKHRRVVIATLRLQEQHLLDSTPDSDRGLDENRRRVLAMATRIHIERTFTPTELNRAQHRDQDPRIAEALSHTDDYGLAEYLAAGPQLLRRWHDGRAASTNPRGAALVTAAVECRRAGFLSPLPRAMLTELHTYYLPTGKRARPEAPDKAWAWATQPWRHTTALLEPLDADPDHVTVFDYIVDHTQRTTPPSEPPPEHLIHIALTHATATDTTLIGHQARRTGRYPLASIAYTQALTHHTSPEHPDTLTSRNNRANVMRALGRLEEAETEHSSVLETQSRILGPEHPDTLISRNNRARVLYDLGRLEEAETEHSSVLETRTRILGPEHPDTLISRNNLASVMRALGRQEEISG